ncbi:hypothetical protein BUALT_BualtUnG0023400 [Buddleja alternifolia]|uniref:Fe2OG dioxygenase domain-containing protein n=1 Tax=Buddleja alternifolia TaxID=168488 RepID=A0AAV6W0H8_9LAMI|nr:hypothetical protein BUALT_BualtUnG0023400 [Buddleja alternifolia]
MYISLCDENNDETQKGMSSVIDFKHLIDTAPDMMKLPPEFVLPLSANPFSVSYAEIPVIDLSRLAESSESRISTVKAISSACELWGFFRIVNHGIDVSLIAEMLEVAEEFFDLSLMEKMKYSTEDVMSPEYLEHIWELTMKIGSAISEGLGLDNGYIKKSFGKGFQILAANYYPPCPEPEKTLGLAAHSDHGALTILMQNCVNGLQVKHNDQWLLLTMYLILSNGKYKSVEHRATVNAQKTTISVAVGHGPELSTVIGPATQLVDPTKEIQYQPTVYKDYIRLQQTTTIRGKTALQAIRTSK